MPSAQGRESQPRSSFCAQFSVFFWALSIGIPIPARRGAGCVVASAADRVTAGNHIYFFVCILCALPFRTYFREIFVPCLALLTTVCSLTTSVHARMLRCPAAVFRVKACAPGAADLQRSRVDVDTKNGVNWLLWWVLIWQVLTQQIRC